MGVPLSSAERDQEQSCVQVPAVARPVAAPVAPPAPAASRGERNWGDLYQDHADFVWRSLRRLGLSPDAAKDGLHDVFLVVHRRMDSFDSALGTERAWLFGIAANVARSEKRRRRPIPVERVEPLSDRSTCDEYASAPSGSGEYKVGYLRVRERIIQAVAGLSPDRRAVFSMFELEGMSCLEIADEMGVAIGTIYSRLHAARAELRQALSDYRPDGATESHSREVVR